MNKLNFLIGMVAAFSFISCTQHKKIDNAKSSFTTATNLIELDNRFVTADSLVVVFYKDPYGKDSLRYTRFYTQYTTVDKNDIEIVLTNLKEPFTKTEKVRKCRSEGKIWCYRKGAIFQTLYFASFNNDCNFIYTIKDGYFFYEQLNDELALRLKVLKAFAKE